MTEFERVARLMRKANAVFVFGSNEAGVHGAGAALAALQHYGAVWGQGVGHHGRSYAIPTKDRLIQTLPLDAIERYVRQFLQYAKHNPQLEFAVTRVGCGLAGLTDADMAPMFRGAPNTCWLPEEWR